MKERRTDKETERDKKREREKRSKLPTITVSKSATVYREVRWSISLKRNLEWVIEIKNQWKCWWRSNDLLSCIPRVYTYTKGFKNIYHKREFWTIYSAIYNITYAGEKAKRIAQHCDKHHWMCYCKAEIKYWHGLNSLVAANVRSRVQNQVEQGWCPCLAWHLDGLWVSGGKRNILLFRTR